MGRFADGLGRGLDPRGVKEPDGYTGWPKADGASTNVMPGLYTDNILGEAMGLRPVVLMADTILKTPALKAKHGQKAEEYLRLAEQIFEKWDSRGCWREVKTGGLWVVPPFGIDRADGEMVGGLCPAEHGRVLPAGQQAELCCASGCWPCTRSPRNRSTASGRRNGGGR